MSLIFNLFYLVADYEVGKNLADFILIHFGKELFCSKSSLALFLAKLILDHRLQEAIKTAHHLSCDSSNNIGDRINLPWAIPIQRKHDGSDKRTKND